MKKLVIIAAAVGTLMSSAPAFAAPWSSVNERQAQIERRIAVGERDGSLTRYEASRLRADYRSIAYRERRYRRNGLSAWERADLNARLDRLSAAVNADRHDRDRRW